jgi:GNAT superfamily N-acetyltransferase
MPKLHTAAEDLWFVGELVLHATVRVVGRPAVGFLARQGAEVDALYLAPQARRGGRGRALIAEAMAVEPVLRLWTFQANTEARAFYAVLGFVEVGRTDGDNDEGLPDVRLEWRRDV